MFVSTRCCCGLWVELRLASGSSMLWRRHRGTGRTLVATATTARTAATATGAAGTSTTAATTETATTTTTTASTAATPTAATSPSALLVRFLRERAAGTATASSPPAATHRRPAT